MSLDERQASARRTRLFRRVRSAIVVLVIGWFFLPYGVRYWIPAWLVFAAALALEVHFFLGGLLRTGRVPPSAPPDRGPQARDLAELGGAAWQETIAVELDGERHFVPAEGLRDEEASERVAAYVEDPEAVLASAEEPAPPAERRRIPYRLYLVEAAVALAIVGGIAFSASRARGWDAVSPANRSLAEAIFSREATRIAGHPARVGCDTSARYVGFVHDADGVAFVGGSRAYLTPGICDTLYQLAFKHRVQSFPGTARALAVLAHESWHLRGERDEGLASCFGFQSGVELGVRLGLSERTARRMMRQQLVTNASTVGANADYLVPDDCRNGGRYDLHPRVPEFP